MTFKIIEITPMLIPYGVNTSRRAPRPLNERQKDYVENYDYKTVFYDIFYSENNVCMVGPNLRNLESIINIGKWSINGFLRRDEPKFKSMWKVDNVSFELNYGELSGNPVNQFGVSCGWLDCDGKIQPNESAIFSGKKVLVSINKNNNLACIKDWIIFYQRTHGIDAVLLYDNDSTEYTMYELLDVIKDIEGIDVGVVVPWVCVKILPLVILFFNVLVFMLINTIYMFNYCLKTSCEKKFLNLKLKKIRA
ncbi:hypothetical protein [Methanobrevibacter filiformis]|uniref:Uncharacterized protein n=1 Tax=Methanobrevibacter filiformis TaxID=55758 RepID=A0A166CNC9_9EURY|nr:hypothetical protein [Methanobrevibacter filiformis]KZX15587.1 hypothetical protein MBFIL_06270 [Methanobrevibacter filiformis]